MSALCTGETTSDDVYKHCAQKRLVLGLWPLAVSQWQTKISHPRLQMRDKYIKKQRIWQNLNISLTYNCWWNLSPSRQNQTPKFKVSGGGMICTLTEDVILRTRGALCVHINRNMCKCKCINRNMCKCKCLLLAWVLCFGKPLNM